MKDFDEKKEVEDALGPISNEVFDLERITNSNAEGEIMTDPDAERRYADIEDGVNMVFDEEGAEGEDEEGFDVDEEMAERAEPSPEMEDNAEELVIGSASSPTKASQDKDIVSPRTVDGFRVRCQFYPRPSHHRRQGHASPHHPQSRACSRRREPDHGTLRLPELQHRHVHQEQRDHRVVNQAHAVTMRSGLTPRW